MRTLTRCEVPTGDILVVQGDLGQLECLSLGDYGKDVNIKCDAMGLTREIEKVEHVPLMPLQKKWVITISTQYGCSMGCKFCDVPHVGRGTNATYSDLCSQVARAMELHPEVTETERLNIHFARMGEPTWNENVLDATRWYNRVLNPTFNVHPVVSTMLPKRNKRLCAFLSEWCRIKDQEYHGNAGLQFSINSTDPYERHVMFNGEALTFPEIECLMHGRLPLAGRKVTLNFALAGWTIDPDVLLQFFNPEHYIVKLTPMHRTTTALANDIETEGDYTTYTPYQATEEKLVAAGYDVLVFIASHEEDDSRITCGNAILSDEVLDREGLPVLQ